MSSLKRILRRLLKGNKKPAVKQSDNNKAKNPKTEKRIQKVMEATGWDHQTSAKNMREAYKTYKIGSRDYVKYAFYALSDDKKEARAKKIHRHNANVITVMEATGKKRKAAENAMRRDVRRFKITEKDYIDAAFYAIAPEKKEAVANNILKHKANVREAAKATGMKRKAMERSMSRDIKRYRITEGIYMANAFYNLTAEEKQAKAKSVKELAAKTKAQREAAIQYAMNEMGWDRATAIKNIADTRKRFKITYYHYRKLRMARVSPEEQEKEYNRLMELRQETLKENQDVMEDLQKKTGWTWDQVLKNYEEIRSRINCNMRDYWMYKIYEMTPEEQDQLFHHNIHNQLKARYVTDPEFKKLLESKELTNHYFDQYIERSWCINQEINFEQFRNMFKDSAGVVCKPIFGLQAAGVKAYWFRDHTMEEVFDIIKSASRSVIEEIVVQHPKMSLLNPSSVNCMRIETVSSNTIPVTEDGKHADILGITLKMGGSNSIIDNLHAGGGVCAGVNLETGVLDTDGVSWNGIKHATHPVTGTVLKGFEIPYFNEAKDFVMEMIENLGIYGIIGWDIAIGEKGPVLIEPNTDPDPALIILPYAADHIGLMDRVKKYLYPIEE